MEEKQNKKSGSLIVTIIICVVAVAAMIGVVIVLSTPSKSVKEAKKEAETEAVKTAEELFEEKDYENALVKYEENIKADNKDIASYLGMAGCYEELKNDNAARKILLDAIDADSASDLIGDVYTLYADICVANDEDFEAYEILNEAGLLDDYDNSSFEMPDLTPHLNEEGNYVYGVYPSYRMDAERINDTIKNADYDDNDFATVYGIQIARVGEGDEATYYAFDQVEWKVLSEDETTVFLQTAKVIDNTCYHEVDEEIHYPYTTLRTWLTGSFIETLTAGDESLLNDISLEPSNNPDYNKKTGDYITDKCTILSIEEVVDGANGYEEGRKDESENRKCGATDYAADKGVYVDSSGNCKWMLRTCGCTRDLVAVVGETGIINCDGYFVNGTNLGVRPVICLTIKGDE